MNQKLFKQVRRFVNDLTLKPLLQIKHETSLYFDLDLTTETAPMFFERFAEEFEIDLGGMDLRPFFQPTGGHGATGGEAVTCLWLFWFFTNERHQFNGLKPLLVRDLVMLAKMKHWCLV